MVEIIVFAIILLIFGLIAIKAIPGHGTLLEKTNKMELQPTRFALTIFPKSKRRSFSFFASSANKTRPIMQRKYF